MAAVVRVEEGVSAKEAPREEAEESRKENYFHHAVGLLIYSTASAQLLFTRAWSMYLLGVASGLGELISWMPMHSLAWKNIKTSDQSESRI